jgi:hypothetical protein
MDQDNPVKDPAVTSEEPRVFKVASPGGRRAFLQTLSKTAAVGGAAVAADNCNSTPTMPSPPPTTSISTTTSTSTTTSVAPTATLAGVVTNQNTGQPIGGARVSVVDGPGRGRSSTTDGNGYYSIAGIRHSSFTARATATNYSNHDRGLTLDRDTRLDFQLRPLAPTTSTTTTRSSTTTRRTGCTCNPLCGCNPLTYFYPN